MKKLLIVGLISSTFSAGAFAAACTATLAAVGAANIVVTAPAAATEMCICDGTTTANASAVNAADLATAKTNAAVAAPTFIKRAFAMQCSANTIVSYSEENATKFVVGAGSRKGNKLFTATTNGGGVAQHTVACVSNEGCIGTDVTVAWTAAKAL